MLAGAAGPDLPFRHGLVPVVLELDGSTTGQFRLTFFQSHSDKTRKVRSRPTRNF